MHPNSLFVAHFIGESNFLEGYITKADGYSELELRDGVKVKAMNSEIKQGERIILAIRPETCEIKKGHNNAENALFGKIEKMTFEGTNIRYEIRLDNGDRMIINRPSLTEEWIKVGEEVTITYPLEKTHLFLYPEAGLTEEISV